jgi:transposase-like protein
VFVPRYSEQQAREAIAASFSYAEALRRLDLCATGGNWKTLQKWVAQWGIDTEHFDPDIARRAALRRAPQPIDEILVEGSTYSRNHLKERLYAAGLKQPICELCGQGAVWRERPMGLILDHVNGVNNDNRLENLRIVCPNCAATLDTHCGRKNGLARVDRECLRCGAAFRPRYARQRYCSRACGMRSPRPSRGVANPALRRVERPPHDELLREIAATSYSAVGRRYGVSDNAVRKWVRQYERERAAALSPPADAAAPR